MNEKLLTYLPYILPVQEQKIDDGVIEITAKHFKAQYGELVCELLRDIKLMPPQYKYINPTELGHTIAKIHEYINLTFDYCHVWKIDNKWHMISSGKPIKNNDLGGLLSQLAKGDVNWQQFYTKQEPQPEIINKFVVAMTFMSLLILFDKLVTRVHTFEYNESFNMNVAQLFNIVDATNQVNMYAALFNNRQSRRKGAITRANLTKDVKATIFDIVKKLGLKATDADKINLGATMARVKHEYEQNTGKAFKLSNKTLEKYIFDALHNKNCS